ncbi:unnamed protein product [Rotaria sp. Silwood1]|nr:unnamed protein product [Rotaria sp. Silwood1]CAF4624843.1 unnamed protein product [Rotaria sp. Silwood1]
MANAELTYEQIYLKVKNGFTGDSSIWDRTYEYIRLHPKDLFFITPHRIWSIGHQIIYHGNLKLFQRLLELYNDKDNLIDIHSTTKDKPHGKTILDIANERKEYYKDQYDYIKRLYDQDKFIEACRKEDWPTIDAILEKDPTLKNEKPPYCSNYFIHILVYYGDIRKFDEYNIQNQPFRLDLQNVDGKTGLDLAKETKNQDFITEIERLLKPVRERGSKKEYHVREEELREYSPHTRTENNNQSTVPSRTTTQLVQPPALPLVQPSPLLTQPPVRQSEPRPVQPPPQSTQLPARQSESTLVQPTATEVSPQLLKKLTCKLTKKIFVDPVIASDGKTYERSAIRQYLTDNRFSPQTGEPMNDEFTDDIATTDLIRTLRKQNKLP